MDTLIVAGDTASLLEIQLKFDDGEEDSAGGHYMVALASWCCGSEFTQDEKWGVSAAICVCGSTQFGWTPGVRFYLYDDVDASQTALLNWIGYWAGVPTKKIEVNIQWGKS